MKIRITLTGTAPLLMHSDRLSDPLDPFSKALKTYSGKRAKTEDDHSQMARIEFEGGMYFDPQLGPYIPGVNIHRSLVEGARFTKKGRHVERGFVPTDDVCPLIYPGPRDVESLWKSKIHVSRMSAGVNQSRVMRTRPIFPEWTCELDAMIDPGQLDLEEVQVIAEQAGAMIGVGDFRPRFGRFTAQVVEI